MISWRLKLFSYFVSVQFFQLIYVYSWYTLAFCCWDPQMVSNLPQLNDLNLTTFVTSGTLSQ